MAALGFHRRQIAVEATVLTDCYPFFHRRSGVVDGGQRLALGLDAPLQDQHAVEALLDFGAYLAADFVDAFRDGGELADGSFAPVTGLTGDLEGLRDTDRLFMETGVRLSGLRHATASLVGRQLRIVVEQAGGIPQLAFGSVEIGTGGAQARIGALRHAPSLVQSQWNGREGAASSEDESRQNAETAQPSAPLGRGVEQHERNLSSDEDAKCAAASADERCRFRLERRTEAGGTGCRPVGWKRRLPPRY